MARAIEGWKYFRDKRSGTYFVRFRHEGRRLNIGTGERDPGAAAEAAGRIYAEVISGRWRQGKGLADVGTPGLPFLDVAARWLADVESHLVAHTFLLYQNCYIKKRFAPFFLTIDRVTSVSIEDYVSIRLRQVQRQTIKAELSVLRRIAKWANNRGYLGRMPQIDLPGRRVLGTKSRPNAKSGYQVFTAEEIERILANLPEWSKPSRRAPRQVWYPVRARYIVAWETALRPGTLNRLHSPNHYRKGGDRLLVEASLDKARYARELPLSQAAREALDKVCPEAGIIFGKHDYRYVLRQAAYDAGIAHHRVERFSDYDFRHSRLTYLGQVTDNLSGVMYIAGHKQPQTTARYMRPQKAAAEEVLRAAAGKARRKGPHPGPQADSGAASFRWQPAPVAPSAPVQSPTRANQAPQHRRTSGPRLAPPAALRVRLVDTTAEPAGGRDSEFLSGAGAQQDTFSEVAPERKP